MAEKLYFYFYFIYIANARLQATLAQAQVILFFLTLITIYCIIICARPIHKKMKLKLINSYYLLLLLLLTLTKNLFYLFFGLRSLWRDGFFFFDDYCGGRDQFFVIFLGRNFLFLLLLVIKLIVIRIVPSNYVIYKFVGIFEVRPGLFFFLIRVCYLYSKFEKNKYV